jgi:hypothetical protein
MGSGFTVSGMKITSFKVFKKQSFPFNFIQWRKLQTPFYFSPITALLQYIPIAARRRKIAAKNSRKVTGARNAPAANDQRYFIRSFSRSSIHFTAV